MTDYFALLGETRRPWLDPEALKQKFLALSAQFHPDRTHEAGTADKEAAQDRYTGLNAAYNCLREPKTRLVHLLELELGAKSAPVQSVPASLMDLFMQISAALRETDALLAQKQAATSPLLKAQAFERARDAMEKVSTLGARIDSWREDLLAELRTLDEQWVSHRENASARSAVLGRLEEIRHYLGYFARWGGQLQERGFQMTLE